MAGTRPYIESGEAGTWSYLNSGESGTWVYLESREAGPWPCQKIVEAAHATGSCISTCARRTKDRL